jgi:hypothetical protein
MSRCENVAAATHAFPRDSMPVADRRMSLTIQCRDPAEYSSDLRGIGAGRRRVGAEPRAFALCENHRRLYEQIDFELVQDAWSPSHTAKPTALP